MKKVMSENGGGGGCERIRKRRESGGRGAMDVE